MPDPFAADRDVADDRSVSPDDALAAERRQYEEVREIPSMEPGFSQLDRVGILRRMYEVLRTELNPSSLARSIPRYWIGLANSGLVNSNGFMIRERRLYALRVTLK